MSELQFKPWLSGVKESARDREDWAMFDVIEECESEIARLQSKLDRYRKALEQFADDKNWDWGNTCSITNSVAKEALSDE